MPGCSYRRDLARQAAFGQGLPHDAPPRLAARRDGHGPARCGYDQQFGTRRVSLEHLRDGTGPAFPGILQYHRRHRNVAADAEQRRGSPLRHAPFLQGSLDALREHHLAAYLQPVPEAAEDEQLPARQEAGVPGAQHAVGERCPGRRPGLLGRVASDIAIGK